MSADPQEPSICKPLVIRIDSAKIRYLLAGG